METLSNRLSSLHPRVLSWKLWVADYLPFVPVCCHELAPQVKRSLGIGRHSGLQQAVYRQQCAGRSLRMKNAQLTLDHSLRTAEWSRWFFIRFFRTFSVSLALTNTRSLLMASNTPSGLPSCRSPHFVLTSTLLATLTYNKRFLLTAERVNISPFTSVKRKKKDTHTHKPRTVTGLRHVSLFCAKCVRNSKCEIGFIQIRIGFLILLLPDQGMCFCAIDILWSTSTKACFVSSELFWSPANLSRHVLVRSE